MRERASVMDSSTFLALFVWLSDHTIKHIKVENMQICD